MRALRLNSLDGPDGLELVDLPEPEPGERAVLIDVHAAGVSFLDLLVTRGEYQVRPDPPFIPGIEVAGTVRTAPEGSEFKVGDRVSAITPLGGGFAEVALAPLDLTFPAPEGASFSEAVALTNSYQTAWLALKRRGRLAPGEVVVVHGAAGGVGTAAIQVAKALEARVLAVTSTGEKASVAREAGADTVLATDSDWLEAIRDETGGQGADVVFDPVGGQRFGDSVRCLRPEGRLLVVGFAGGEIPELAVNRVLLRQIDVVGVNIGGVLAFDPGYPRRCAREIAQLFAAGALRPLIGRRYRLAEGAKALHELDERRALGKLILETHGVDTVERGSPG